MPIKRHTILLMKWIRESVFSPIILTVIATIIIGVVITNHYGISWDEPRDIRYAVESLRAYYAEPAWHWTFPAGPTGPFSFMLTEVAARVFAFARPGWLLTDGRHFTYFIMFQIATISLFGLCLRFSNKRAALFTSILFMTQPLLFGHAFINPKDIPFMAFFSASIAIGLAMTDAQMDSPENPIQEDADTEEHRGWTDILQTWRDTSGKHKALLLLISAISVLTVLEILAFNRVFLPNLLSLIYNAYHNTAVELINSLFRLISENAGQIDVTSYMWKVTRAYWFLRVPSSIGIFFALAIILGGKFRTPLRVLTTKKHILLISAGILLGLTTSIRIMAPFAGLLVSVYFLARQRLKGFKSLVAYWGLAIVTSFITRPYFWENPIERGWKSLISSGDFNFDGAIFFQGEVYSASSLPSSYSPILLLRQFTEPLLLLILFGAMVTAWKMLKRKVDRPSLLVMVGWFLVPIALVTITKVQPYDNFRQLLFITVPFFIFASVGVDYILGKLRSRFLLSIIIIALLFPGILGIVRLHPYEYIYYNSFAGGMSGAAGFAELDYWCTSYRAGMDYINEAAPEGSTIAIWGPLENAKPFARGDLNLVNLAKGLQGDDADYALICIRFMSEKEFSNFENVWEISRGGMPLAVVKRVE